MVVLQPIKPGPPRVNLTLKRGRARRALSLLGNNNTQQNLQLAESLLTISAEEFTNKWNFDPIQGVPLPSGRFQWTPLTAVTSSDPTVLPSSDATTTTTKAVTSCNLSSSSSSSTTTSSSSSSSSSPADNPIPNPAEDKSQEQKTCVTLPPPPPPPLPAPGANVVLCQVSAGQLGDLHKNHKVSESETVPAAAAKSGDSCESHLCCCTRTCGCSGPKGSSSSDKATDNMNQGSEKDNNLRVSSSNGIKTEADSGIDSDDSIVDDRESTFVTPSDNSDSLQAAKLRQTCITEFVRPQKLSTFTAPEPLHHSSSTTTTTSTYSKKRPASSLQEQLNQPPHKKVLLHLRA